MIHRQHSESKEKRESSQREWSMVRKDVMKDRTETGKEADSEARSRSGRVSKVSGQTVAVRGHRLP